MSMKLPGDADITIDGVAYRLRLTLGALAYLEEELGAGNFDELVKRLSEPSPSALLHLLNALIIGGGAEMTVAYLKGRDIDARQAAAAIGKAFRALADDRDQDRSARGEGQAPGKPRPRRNRPWLKAARDGFLGSDGFATR